MSIGKKIGVAGLLLLAVGLPVLDTWAALLLAACWLALVFSTCRAGWRPLASAVAVVLVAAGVKAVLPRADIAEAHNAFLVVDRGEPLERGLPLPVFQSWKAHLDTFYPHTPEQDAVPYQWRLAENTPRALFTASADAIWRRPIFTRQVDAIRFTSIGEFRGGFANESEYSGKYDNLYNFWNGAIARQTMPFYVMYRLTRASVGSRLAWKGQVFWEREDGAFDEIVHRNGIASRAIGPADAGRRVYAAFFPAFVPDMYFALEPSARLAVAGWARVLLSIAAALAIMALTIRPRWPGYLSVLLLFAMGYVKMAFFSQIGSAYLGRNYPPNWGGDDGMAFDGWGRAMAMLVRHGQVVEALKGTEPVYWFTPGMRYVRMVEKLIFGDTNHLHALLLACLPIAIFFLVRHLAGPVWAWALAAIFCVMPVGNLSLLQYIAYANAGYAEAVAAGLFLVGLTLALRTQPAWGGGGRNLFAAWVAGAALAASMFIRPNFTLAVVWIGAAHAWSSMRRRDAATLAAFSAGLALALWMPFHNWFYGGAFYLISRSGATISVPLGVGDYAAAVRDLLSGHPDTPAIALTSAQLNGWLWGPATAYYAYRGMGEWAATAHAVNVAALAVAFAVVLLWCSRALPSLAGLGVVAAAAILALVPMLFIFNTSQRYAVLGWDLSLVVLVAFAARLPALVRGAFRERHGAAPLVHAGR